MGVTSKNREENEAAEVNVPQFVHDFCNFCRLDMGITSKNRKESEAAKVNVKGTHEGTLQ